MEKQKYYLGLDMGTSSVGWAVTDENYRLMRAKGKDLWGIREFEEAATAVERRTHRISRRRRQREQVRIGLLKSYFHDALLAVDENFLVRLENSKYYLEDKDSKLKNKNGIFDDENYGDKEYYKEYPTIFHLRKELLTSTEPHDVRLVYLAILNMFKHRGHFLNAGLTTSEVTRGIQEVYNQLVELLLNITEINLPLDINCDELGEILSSREYSRTRKHEEVLSLMNIEKKKKKEVIVLKALCGLKIDIKQIFEDIHAEEKIDICFADSGYEDKIDEIIQVLGEENYQIIELMKEIYDIGSLAGLLKGYNFLSEARVAEYEKHKKDLEKLKSIMKEYGTKEEYDWMFRSEEAGTYSAYVNSFNTGKKQRRSMKERTREAFYVKLKKVLKTYPEEVVTTILTEIDNETFLPKQLTSSNGIIPNQVHRKEMEKILKNAKEYLPFLNDVDESGLSVAERIVKLFSFQIPYYVGPISNQSAKNGGNGWVVRKEEGQVLPWNINEKIDLLKTSEEFISRLVRNCTYISGEKVLPKASLEYEAYCVLNEINNLKIEGERISVELKQDIYRDLFQKGKRVTKTQLVKYLLGKGVLREAAQLSGIDVNINNMLASYGKFKAILGEKIEEDDNKKMVEQIIFWCTVYGDSKKMLRKQIEDNYGDKLTSEEIKRILGFKMKDWGKLSKEFLELSGCDKRTGEVKSLIRAMWDNNLNMMELLHSDEFTYGEELNAKQSNATKTLAEMQPEDLDEWYFSAPVKRMIWQTFLVMKEIEKVLGAPPERLFIEMTRNDGEKGDRGRKDSRKKKFLELYKSVKDDVQDWKKVIEDADTCGKLRSKKMYLYLTQMGRCMYTGKRIELEDLFDNNLYDIDHIYPRHFVKDDNLDNNLVLVDKRVNARKSDNYPLDMSIRESQEVASLWKTLREKTLITEEKYRRLTGRNSFTEEQKAGFIARQLVETSQGTKGVADILKQALPNTKIVYSKASNVAEFRHSRGLVKSRLVNDFHHANDAYLNIVVGNVYYEKFTSNPLNFIKKEYARDAKKFAYNLSRMFDWDVVRDGRVAWKAQSKDGEPGTIATVKEMLAKNTPLLTRLSFEGHGALANETLYSAKKAKKENYIALKSSDERMSDVKKYGGFTSATIAYFFLVEHEVKGEKVRTLENVPLFLKHSIEKEENGLLKYCLDKLGLVNPSIRVKRIKIQSLIKRNGYLIHISGKSNKQIIMRNAVNLCLKQEWIAYIKAIEKYLETGILDAKITCESNEELFEILSEKHGNGIFSKRINSVGKKLQESVEIFADLDVSQQCKVLGEILKLTTIGPTSADLTLLGGAAKSGLMLMSKNISDADEMLLMNQSVTGIFENSIDLKTV